MGIQWKWGWLSMSELGLVVVGLLCAGGSAGAFFAVRKVLLDGASDDVNFPLASCDTSMLDEINGDCKVGTVKSAEIVVLPFEEVKH